MFFFTSEFCLYLACDGTRSNEYTSELTLDLCYLRCCTHIPERNEAAIRSNTNHNDSRENHIHFLKPRIFLRSSRDKHVLL